MIVSRVKWKDGFGSLHKADAQLVANEISEIGGDVSPEQIVERAKDASSELHKCFTWDDTVAANKWRIYEARQIVCHLVYEQTERKEDEPEKRIFLKNEAGSGYKPTETIFRKDDEYAKMLQEAYSELLAYKRKYSWIAERAGFLDMLDELIAQIA